MYWQATIYFHFQTLFSEFTDTEFLGNKIVFDDKYNIIGEETRLVKPILIVQKRLRKVQFVI